MYGDQFEEFVWGYLVLKDSMICTSLPTVQRT